MYTIQLMKLVNQVLELKAQLSDHALRRPDDRHKVLFADKELASVVEHLWGAMEGVSGVTPPTRREYAKEVD